MAEADWAELTGTALGSGEVARGVSNAFTVPNGGTAFVFGFRSLTSATGFAGLYVDLANFKPIAGTNKGGSIRAAMKKYAGPASSAPLIGLVKGTDPATAEGYLLGLSEGSSYYELLNKGVPSSGMDASGSSVLRTSTSSYTDTGDAASYWHHLRLDVLVNPHGEVVLNVYKNDLSAHAVTAPSWAAITGMGSYTDDSLGVLSGSLPFLDGFYAVFGHYTDNQSGAVSLFDHVEVLRQTAP